MSALVASRIASWCSRSGSKRSRGLEQRRHLLGQPRLDRLGLAPGRASARAVERCDFVEPRRQQPPSAVAFALPHLDKRRQRFGEAGDDRRLGGATILFALVLLGDFHHALERQNAVERWRRGVPPFLTGL